MSTAPVEMSVVPTDEELERLIDLAYRRMVTAVQTPDQLSAFEEMVCLVRKRSPLQIKTMERERRLRR